MNTTNELLQQITRETPKQKINDDFPDVNTDIVEAVLGVLSRQGIDGEKAQEISIEIEAAIRRLRT